MKRGVECITRLVGPQIGSGHLHRGASLGHSVSHVFHPRAHPSWSIKIGALASPVIPLTISDWGQTLYVRTSADSLPGKYCYFIIKCFIENDSKCIAIVYALLGLFFSAFKPFIEP